jgi:hypothetical protein
LIVYKLIARWRVGGRVGAFGGVVLHRWNGGRLLGLLILRV